MAKGRKKGGGRWVRRVHDIVDSDGVVAASLPFLTAGKRQGIGRPFFMLFTDNQDLLALSRDREIGGEALRVFLHILNKATFSNATKATQTDMAANLGMDRSNIARALRPLVEKGWVERAGGGGRTAVSYRISPRLGWFGDPEDHRIETFKRENANRPTWEEALAADFPPNEPTK